jgi:opacity protein-like surface antigen
MYPPGPPPPPPSGSPPVVIYQPPPPALLDRPEVPPPYGFAGPPRRPLGAPGPEWGANLRVEGAAIGHGTQGNTGMGGFGGGLRFKPTPSVGLEGDLDFVGGHGYQGESRNETAFTLNGLLFLNPKSRAQIYILAGFGWSWAHVTCDPSVDTCSSNGPTNSVLDQHYTYFGGQLGTGLEFRISRSIAFDVDMRGFVRSRTDALAQSQPEFTNSSGQTTNTSGGVLFTGGLSIYF